MRPDEELGRAELMNADRSPDVQPGARQAPNGENDSEAKKKDDKGKEVRAQ